MRRSELLRLAGEMDEVNPYINVRGRTRELLDIWAEQPLTQVPREFDYEAGAPVSYVRGMRAAHSYCVGPDSGMPKTEAWVVRALLDVSFAGGR